MSYIYLQEQGEVSSAECFSDIPQYVLSKLRNTIDTDCLQGNAMEVCQSSQYGTTFEHSTASLGEGKLTYSAAASHAKILAPPEEEQESTEKKVVCGDIWRELPMKFDSNGHFK